MMELNDIRNNLDIVNEIDWGMTPEEAVTLYLEWGNNWSHGRRVKSKDDVTYYFAVYYWDERPKITLIRRNSEEAVELAHITMPKELEKSFIKSVKGNKGVYAIDDAVKGWLEKELSG